jgi:hypothetical protein
MSPHPVSPAVKPNTNCAGVNGLIPERPKESRLIIGPQDLVNKTSGALSAARFMRLNLLQFRNSGCFACH